MLKQIQSARNVSGRTTVRQRGNSGENGKVTEHNLGVNSRKEKRRNTGWLEASETAQQFFVEFGRSLGSPWAKLAINFGFYLKWCKLALISHLYEPKKQTKYIKQCLGNHGTPGKVKGSDPSEETNKVWIMITPSHCLERGVSVQSMEWNPGEPIDFLSWETELNVWGDQGN